MASLRPGFPLPAEQLKVVERHITSDEAFVLLEGRVVLVIAGRGAAPGRVQAPRMEQGKVYTVRRDTRHTALLGRRSMVLVVEKRDTGAANTQHARHPSSQRSRMREIWNPVTNRVDEPRTSL